MCPVPNSGTFQKHHFGSKYSTRFQIKNFGSKRLILVLDLEEIVPITQRCSVLTFLTKGPVKQSIVTYVHKNAVKPVM